MAQPDARQRRGARGTKLSVAVVASIALAGCGSGGGGAISSKVATSRPSISITRTAGGGANLPNRTTAPTSDEATPSTPIPTTAPSASPTTAPTSRAPKPTAPARTTAAPSTPVASSTAPTNPVAADSQSNGTNPLWWILLAMVVLAAVIAAIVVSSRKRSARRAAARALITDTQMAIDRQLPQVLMVVVPRTRSLSWAPVDAELVALQQRWAEAVTTASDEDRPQAQEVARLLDDLLVAVRAENDALLQGLDWTLLRPRVDQDRGAILAQLTPVQL